MASQPRLIFINLPVKDVAASKEFFGALGFEFDAKFTNDECACMVVSDMAYVMLLHESRFVDFTTKPIADARESTEVLVALSAESREAVDAFADSAIAGGGSAHGEPTDYGFMYQRAFNDLDGHVWEVMWMSQEAIEAGPPDMAPTA